jgi:predicted Fe-S protein YdhL (DUF1289 family)
MDEKKDVCIGCGRTLAEIAAWSRMTEDERRRVVALLAARKRFTALASNETKS